MNWSFDALVYFFFFYSFAGWCTESVYATCVGHRFVNRGFLYGPICPIYGLGVLFITGLCSVARGSLPLIFLLCFVGCSALEYSIGFLLEVVFHSKWWDYSDLPFQIKGRVCLYFSLIWGALGLVTVTVVNSAVYTLIAKILSYSAGRPIAAVLLVCLACDLTATLVRLAQFRKRLTQLETISLEIRTKLNDLKTTAVEKELTFEQFAKSIKEKYGNLETVPSEIRERLKTSEKIFLRIASLSREQPDLIPLELKTRFEQAVNRLYTKNIRLFRTYPHFNSKRIKDAFAEIRSRLKV